MNYNQRSVVDDSTLKYLEYQMVVGILRLKKKVQMCCYNANELQSILLFCETIEFECGLQHFFFVKRCDLFCYQTFVACQRQKTFLVS